MEVINLPKGWNLLPLNQICDLQNGYAFKSTDYVDFSSTLNCRMSNIRPNGFFDLEHNQKFLPDSYTKKYQQYLLKDGDVIIAMTDMATQAKILGVPTVVETQGKNLLLNQRVGKLIIKRPDLICFPYLKYALNREQVKKSFLKFAGGGLQINLGKDDILSVEIPLPPLQEQKRIAEILDRAEELRSKRREAIAQLDTLTQAIFLEMFGDPILNPYNFPIRKMIEIVDLERPITYGILMPGSEQMEGVKYVRVVDMKNGGIQLSGIRKTTPEISYQYRRSLLKTGDLLLSIRGHVGRLATVPEELDGANITQDTARLAIREASTVFVRECLRTISFQQWMDKHTKGVAVRGINLGDVKLMPIILPPVDLQRKFAHQAETIEKLKAAHCASLSELDALFASLQHRAFRGEL